jgi:hypothetical protein
MTWSRRHDSVLKHIAVCLKSALESLSTVEVLGRTAGPGWWVNPGFGHGVDLTRPDQTRPDLVIIDRSDHGRHRISLVELTCPWDTDADKARDRKISGYAGLKEELSNQGWDCGLYTIKVGA